MPVGYEYFSFNPNVPQGSLPLFGGEYSRSIYSDLWDWVQEQTGYLKTEVEWQALATSNNGNVPFYSSGDGSTTFRVPSLSCWVRGATGVQEVGSYKAAGLPNITGALTPNDTTSSSVDIDFTGTGAVRATNASRPSGSTGTNNWNTWAGFNIDASRSSSIYGNSTTVQPESIVGMWLVKAYGTIVDTGQINEQQYIDLQLLQYLPLAGGTMTGDIVTSPNTTASDWSYSNNTTVTVTSRYGDKGTMDTERVYHTLAMARDDSSINTNSETCRYGLVEVAVNPDTSVATYIRAYKNEANSTTSVNLEVGFNASGEKYAKFDGKNIAYFDSNNKLVFPNGNTLWFT